MDRSPPGMDGFSAQKACIFVWFILEVVRAPMLLEKLLPVTFDCKAICEMSSCFTNVDCRTMEVEFQKKKPSGLGGV